MTRLLGSVLVAGAALWGWQRQWAERRRRMDTLWAISTGLSRMAEAIRLERTPMPRLLKRLEGDFFRLLGEALGAGETAETAWRRAADRVPLSPADRAALAEAAGGLSGDEEQICRALGAAAQRLRRSLEAERAATPEREKRTAALWLSGGALLVILLM